MTCSLAIAIPASAPVASYASAPLARTRSATSTGSSAVKRKARRGRQPHELLARAGRHRVHVPADLDDALQREVAHDRRIGVLERAPERRRGRPRLAARRREESAAHERIRSPVGSKNAPCVMRAPRRSRSTWISTRVPGSDRFVGTHARPITCPTASLRRALVTRPAGRPSMTICAPSAGRSSSSIVKPTSRSFSSRCAKCSRANLPTKSSLSSFGSQDMPAE